MGEREEASDLEATERLLAVAAAIKRERSIEWRIKGSGLKVRKTMASFDWDFQPKLDRKTVEGLFALSFVERREDLADHRKDRDRQEPHPAGARPQSLRARVDDPLLLLRGFDRQPLRGPRRRLLRAADEEAGAGQTSW